MSKRDTYRTRTLFGVRYPDGSVQPVSSKPAAKAHAAAGNEHAARRVKDRPGTVPSTPLVVVTCEQSPWVELEE